MMTQWIQCTALEGKKKVNSHIGIRAVSTDSASENTTGDLNDLAKSYHPSEDQWRTTKILDGHRPDSPRDGGRSRSVLQ